ncbi:MAG: CopD family protein, partial [Actinomycetota bacterium]
MGLPIALVVAVRPVLRRRDVRDETLLPRARRLLLVACALVTVAATVLAVGQMAGAYRSFSLGNVGSFLQTISGRAWLVRVGLAGGLALVLTLAKRPGAWLAASVLAGAGVQASISLSGHSASIVGGRAAPLSDFAHLAGSALWAGGLVALATVLPGVLDQQDHDQAAGVAAGVIRRFSNVAVLGLGLGVTTGLLLAAWHVPDWSALASTVYGGSLLTKVALVLVAFGLGSLSRLVVHRRLSRGTASARSFVRAVRVEAAVVVWVLFISGLMASAPTADAAAARPGVAEAFERTVSQGPLQVSLRILPGQVGLNVFDVVLTRDGEPVRTADNPALLLTLPEERLQLPPLPLQPAGAGLYSALGSLSLPGGWEVRVSEEVGGRYGASRFAVGVAAAPSAEGQGPPGNRPFARAVRLAAVAVAVLASLTLLVGAYSPLKGAGKGRGLAPVGMVVMAGVVLGLGGMAALALK